MRQTAVIYSVCILIASTWNFACADSTDVPSDDQPVNANLNWVNAATGDSDSVTTIDAEEEEPSDAGEAPQLIQPSAGQDAVGLDTVELDTAEVELDQQGASLIPPEFRVSRRIAPSADVATEAPEEFEAAETETPAPPSFDEPRKISSPAIPDPLEIKPQLSPEMTLLRNQIRQTLDIYYQRRLNTRDHGPWEIMHSVVSFGVNAMVEQDGPGGRPITAIGWLCFNRPARGLTLFTPQRDGFVTRQGPGMQGHEGQLLAILAQAKLQRDYPLQVGDREFSIADLIEFEKRTCRPHAEHTFKLIGLAHYLDANDKWKNDLGQDWSIERLVKEELSQPIRGAACGGSHRLYGLAYAVQRRRKAGEPIDGVFAKTEKYIRDYHRYTFSLQNSDGSFSTRWFEGRGDSGDTDRKMKTTGHILEFMLYTLPDSQVENPQITRAASFLTDLLQQNASRRWENGPLGHAVHALALYGQRRFGDPALSAPSLSDANVARDRDQSLRQ